MDSSNSILEEEIQAAEEMKAVDNNMIDMDNHFTKVESYVLAHLPPLCRENDLLAT